MSADRWVTRFTVPGGIEAVRPAAARLVTVARRLGVTAAQHSLFENAIVEALNNAVQHAACGVGASLQCEVELERRHLTICVLSEGARRPVALTAPAESTAPASWQDLPESGDGLYLIRAVFPTSVP